MFRFLFLTVDSISDSQSTVLLQNDVLNHGHDFVRDKEKEVSLKMHPRGQIFCSRLRDV